MNRIPYKRLLHLAGSGDTDAAKQLRVEALRRKDFDAAVTATIALQDVDGLIELIEDALGREDFTQTVLASAPLGVPLDKDVLESIKNMLSQGNGTRRVRLLNFSQVLQTAFAARRSPEGLAVMDGGCRKGGRILWTTLCLAFYDSEHDVLTLGIHRCKARKASPASAWPEFEGGWDRQFSKNIEAARKWAKRTAEQSTQKSPRNCMRLTTGDLHQAFAPVHVERSPDPDDGKGGQRFADLRALLAQPPTETAWRALCKLLGSWPKTKGQSVALNEAESVLASWPQDLRQPPNPLGWVNSLLKRSKPKAHWRLYRTLPEVDVEKLAELGDGDGSEHLAVLEKWTLPTLWSRNKGRVHSVVRLIALPYLDNLRELHLIDISHGFSSDDFASIFAPGRLTRLEKLTVRISFAEAGSHTFLDTFVLPALRELDVWLPQTRNDSTLLSTLTLLSRLHEAFPALERLSIFSRSPWSMLTHEQQIRLQTTPVPVLQFLTLINPSQLSDGALARAFFGRMAAQATHLSLTSYSTEHTLANLNEALEAVEFPQLKALRFGLSGLRGDVLLNYPQLLKLETLEILNGHLTLTEVRKHLEAMPKLKRLDLGNVKGITKKGREKLAQHPKARIIHGLPGFEAKHSPWS